MSPQEHLAALQKDDPLRLLFEEQARLIEEQQRRLEKEAKHHESKDARLRDQEKRLREQEERLREQEERLAALNEYVDQQPARIAKTAASLTDFQQELMKMRKDLAAQEDLRSTDGIDSIRSWYIGQYKPSLATIRLVFEENKNPQDRLIAFVQHSDGSQLLEMAQQYDKEHVFTGKDQEQPRTKDQPKADESFYKILHDVLHRSKVYALATQMPKAFQLHLHSNALLHPFHLFDIIQHCSKRWLHVQCPVSHSIQPGISGTDTLSSAPLKLILVDPDPRQTGKPQIRPFVGGNEDIGAEAGKTHTMFWREFAGAARTRYRHDKKHPYYSEEHLNDDQLFAWFKVFFVDRMIMPSRHADWQTRLGTEALDGQEWVGFNKATTAIKWLVQPKLIFQHYIHRAIDLMIHERTPYAEWRHMFIENPVNSYMNAWRTSAHDGTADIHDMGSSERKHNPFLNINNYHSFDFERANESYKRKTLASVLDPLEQLFVIHEAVKERKARLKDGAKNTFIGIKLIFSIARAFVVSEKERISKDPKIMKTQADKEKAFVRQLHILEWLLESQELRELIPGFDLVGHEGRQDPPSAYHLRYMLAYCDRLDLRIPLHAGEGKKDTQTIEHHLSTFKNRVVRIAHGHELWHAQDAHDVKIGTQPLLTFFKENHIALEQTLASNQLLAYTVSDGDHPIMRWLAKRIPCVLAGDNPGMFRSTFANASSMAIEIYLFTQMSRVTFAEIAYVLEKSIMHSLLGSAEKAKALKHHQDEMAIFIKRSIIDIHHNFTKGPLHPDSGINHYKYEQHDGQQRLVPHESTHALYTTYNEDHEHFKKHIAEHHPQHLSAPVS